MAKQHGIIRLRGTINGITFLHTRNGDIVRGKTGNTPSRIAHDPAFERTRENMREFALLSRAGKYLREAVLPWSSGGARDVRLNTRLIQLLNEVKKLDVSSPRGERNVATALNIPGVAALFKGFEFNVHAHLRSLLLHPFEVELSTGMVTLDDLDVRQGVVFPAVATHVVLTAAWVNVDFATGNCAQSASEPLVLGRDEAVQLVELVPTFAPSGDGVTFYLLRIGFLQVVNGVRYVLRDSGMNSLSVVG